jgi:hypothetical protein
VEGSLSFLRLRSCMNICLTNPFRSTMPLPMWRQQHVAFRAYSKESLYKRRTRRAGILFWRFSGKKSKKSTHRLKHINLKQASDQIRSSTIWGKRSTGIPDELAENKKVLAEAKFAHLHNHTQFSVLQSTIGIRLVAATAKKTFEQSLWQIPTWWALPFCKRGYES